MSFKIGIIGLPNVGKSTFFEAITRKQVDKQNYPFCTIDPNVGTVAVPDRRLLKLAEVSKSKKTVFTTVEFVDIAGLVKGAHQGKGLGNKFLSHIREMDALIEVLRDFKAEDVFHVEGGVDAKRDQKIIDTELIIADIQVIENVIKKNEKDVRFGDKKVIHKIKTLKKTKEFLEEERMIKDLDLNKEERAEIKEFNFLTAKPIIYLKNVDEKREEDGEYLTINATLEVELAALTEGDARDYLQSLGLKESGLSKVIKKGYDVLGLISFFTSGEKETKAWTVERGSFAPVAAGKIHGDFQKSFIRAEVVNWEDFVDCGGWSGGKEKGKVKDKGKDYIVKDGDVIFFKVDVN